MNERRRIHALGNEKKAMSQRHRLGMGSYLSTSSGGDLRSLGVASNPTFRLEPRHFKSKEGMVWLNMFETISNNYCLARESSQHSRQRQPRFGPGNGSHGRRVNSNSRE